MSRHAEHRRITLALIEHYEKMLVDLKEDLRKINEAENKENQLQMDLGEVMKK